MASTILRRHRFQGRGEAAMSSHVDRLMNDPGTPRVLDQFAGWSNRSRGETSAAVRANVFEHVFDAT